ncbi:MAG: L-aspartate oxidase [Victivallales bacterium]|nr:L-aspartate oxidase [Victivallales bacterium]
MNKTTRLTFDFLIIGSGGAGLTSALKLAKLGKVAVLSKREADNSNTTKAQGGIACVMDDKDTYKDHVEDTLVAGAGMCKKNIVKKIIKKGPASLKELIKLGAHFTTRGEMGDDRHCEDYHLGREGGHHKRRVLHAGDITGTEIQDTLLRQCRENENITIFENYAAIDLICSWRLGWLGENYCLGAYALDTNTNKVNTFISSVTVLATGGAGKAYLYTSNPDIACGAGVAMAYRAYAKIVNMEFFQFHPTILYHPDVKSFLISEAVRGEGALLKIKDKRGRLIKFMHRYHEMKSLAPRDIVARAIDNEMKRTGSECVYLDIRSQSEDFLKKRFPNIFSECQKIGLNMAKDPIPVVPAAHYCCGGIKTDENGFTGINGLYAAGEVACNGFHGANRLASNSLLEALCVPKFIYSDVKNKLKEIIADRPSGNIPDWKTGEATDSDELVVISHNWDEIRRFMWDYVGIFRTNKRLERAKARIRNIRKEIEKYYWDFYVTLDLIELRNISTVAEIIIDSALSRKESRGLHFNADYPDKNSKLASVDTEINRPHTF